MDRYDIKQLYTALEAIYQAFGRKTLSTFVGTIEQLSLAQRQPDDTIQQYDIFLIQKHLFKNFK
eukprot:Pgem_evm2s10061